MCGGLLFFSLWNLITYCAVQYLYCTLPPTTLILASTLIFFRGVENRLTEAMFCVTSVCSLISRIEMKRTVGNGSVCLVQAIAVERWCARESKQASRKQVTNKQTNKQN